LNIDFAFWGGIIGAFMLVRYAWRVARKKEPPGPMASWLMWEVLNVLMLTTSILAKKSFWLPLGWTIGSGLIVITHFWRGKLKWSKRETLSAFLAAVATMVWLRYGPEEGIVAGTFALTFAGIPMLADMVSNPLRSTFPIWFTTCVACLFTLYAANWSFSVGTFLPWCSLGYNAIMATLVLRRPRA